jgi:hypothetical protein
MIRLEDELKFIDCGEHQDYIEVVNHKNIIIITGKHGHTLFEIDLDKSTAIKFAKTIRTEINKITESEV